MSSLEAVLDRPHSSKDESHRTPAPEYRVLVADDQRDVIQALRLLFSTRELATLGATTPAEALSLATAHPVDAALVDLNYEAGDTNGQQGLALVAALHRQAPHLPIIVMTAWSTIDLALDAAKRGASDFVEKPWDESRLVTLVRAHAELGRARRRIAELEAEVRQLRGGAELTATTGPLPNLRLHDVEGLLVRRAMEHYRGNISRAARALGLSRAALYRRLERHGIRS
jgi:DNA-binding NtrC family response regulator